MKRIVAALTAGCVAWAAIAFAQSPGESGHQQDQPTGTQTRPSDEDVRAAWDRLPWPVKAGVRSMDVTQSFQVVDQVVLVPDGATYLDEIGKWGFQEESEALDGAIPRLEGEEQSGLTLSTEEGDARKSSSGRRLWWPVLIEGDGELAGMFIRAFKPAVVLRRTSVGAMPAGAAERQALVEKTVARVWGGTGDQTIAESFRTFIAATGGYRPPGIVIGGVDDPAWTALVALAAGRGEAIGWLDGAIGEPNGELDDQGTRSLMNSVAALADASGYGWRELGDDIDAVTMCRRMAGRTRVTLPGPQGIPAGNDGPMAMTDALGRHAEGNRWAITGWIFGSEERCAYVAMCSMFLARRSVAMLNGYPEGGNWDSYAMDGAAETLSQHGFTIDAASREEMLLRPWQSRMASGLNADVAVINSKGNWDWFHLYRDELGYAEDVPVLNVPVAVHMIHSWSFTQPEDKGSIGGRWLAHGAYAYVGAMWEPYLGAFVPPNELARRWVNYVPFLMAGRLWDGQGPLSATWRVNTYGDPLMLCEPPARPGAEARPRSRVQRRQGRDRYEDVKERARELMKRAVDEPAGEAMGESARELALTGRDEMAISVWKAADRAGAGRSAAYAALGPLFRAGHVEDFLRAFEQSATARPAAVDMLWAMLTPRLNSLDARRALELLEGNIRGPNVYVDVQRLKPALERTFGRMRGMDLVKRGLAQLEPANPNRAKLEAMLK